MKTRTLFLAALTLLTLACSPPPACRPGSRARAGCRLDIRYCRCSHNPNGISMGVAINMNLVSEKIVFEINLAAARKAGLDISSKLLQLAVKVHQ